MFSDVGKGIVVLGVVFVVIGGLVWVFGKLPFAGKLPGDIVVKRDNFTFYAPIATSILISIVLSVLFSLVFLIRK
jgi:hypothetical protein